MTRVRIATYNIHKGVQGFGPRRRLEIHNLGHAIEQLDADIVCLQEVRSVHRKEAKYFARWPELPQADFLAPEGYEAVYRTNAITRHGEHGNAMLSRWPVVAHQHEDMSDHRFEQRGLLHTEVLIASQTVHVIVVHLGLIRASRVANFPSRLPIVQLDHIYARGLTPLSCHVPRGPIWGRMSDHLPLIGEFEMLQAGR
jgi:endonuclease/exonuclease/phosphatase family metal-dependent hydrolase